MGEERLELNRELHRRLDGEATRQLSVEVLEGFYQQMRSLIAWKGLDEDEGLRLILAAGLKSIKGWRGAKKPLDQMSQDEMLTFLQDRAASLDASYSMIKFQAFQVMRENDALELNLRGLLPQLEAARQRVVELEEEVVRLRGLVSEENRTGQVFVAEADQGVPARARQGRIRSLLAGGG